MTDSNEYPIKEKTISVTGESYETDTEFDYATGNVLNRIDPYGNNYAYAYDQRNRPTGVTWNGKTVIAISYDCVSRPYSATAATYFDEGKGVPTVTFIDGFGKVLQVKKRSIVDIAGVPILRWVSSGRFQRDDLGRTVKQGESFDTDSGGFDLLVAPWGSYETFAYDKMGRITEVRSFSAQGIQMAGRATEYEDTAEGLETTVTDALGRKKTIKQNVFGETVRVTDDKGGQNITTVYEYDGTGRLSSLIEDGGRMITGIVYDAMGRRTGITTPDSGNWKYAYNEYGDLIERTDANGNISTYRYDNAGRLERVLYGDARETEFVYGTTGNQKGRLVRERSIGYTNNYDYDAIGNVVRETRRFRESDYVTRYDHALLGQLKKIVYPDDTVVCYGYNQVGDLIKVGDIAESDRYVKEIRYNKDGRRTSIAYGNGVVTAYAYDPDRKNIRSIATRRGNDLLDKVEYGMDLLGNITGTTNTVLGGTTLYQYDALGRMVQADAFGYTIDEMNGKNEYGFNRSGGITAKSGVGAYTFWPDTHRVKNAGRFSFAYDANGNVTTRTETVDSDEKKMELHYDVRNVMTFATNAHTHEGGGVWSRYTYDADGLRLEKQSSLGNHTVYPNGYYSIKTVQSPTNIFTQARNECAQWSTGKRYTSIGTRSTQAG